MNKNVVVKVVLIVVLVVIIAAAVFAEPKKLECTPIPIHGDFISQIEIGNIGLDDIDIALFRGQGDGATRKDKDIELTALFQIKELQSGSIL